MELCQSRDVRGKCPDELGESALRMVYEAERDCVSRWEAVSSVAEKLGPTPETVRKWPPSGSTRPSWSATAAPGGASTTWSWPPWNGSTGSTAGASITTMSAASLQPKPRTSTTVNSTQPTALRLNQTACVKPGEAQSVRLGCLELDSMGVLKTRRQAKRLRARAEADRAVRDSWVRRHDAIFMGFQVAGVGPNAYEPSSWCEMFRDFDGGPPSRQELEWWRAMCGLRSSRMIPGGWLPAIAAMIDAIDAMLPEAVVGPSPERYP